MQERSEAERRAIWPCLKVATCRNGEGSEATEPYNKDDQIRPHSIRSLQFDRKVRPLSFRPEKFYLFTATLGRSQFLEHRPHCRSEELLKSAASKSCQLVDRRANDKVED